ncbi:uncharacterized protein LOC134814003 [Bolinopsis microptera]|uniref:uncharacterized protein LOC134814003 n=1 Tax=Bolinopsis microptera TaxID=2820187 RepID=UPI00307AE241
MYKRYQYITEKQNQLVLSTSVQLNKCSNMSKLRAAIMWTKVDNHKVKSLTRASCTMLIIVLSYTIFYSYTWFICIANTLVLLGAQLPSFSKMTTDRAWMYISNSFHITVFFQSALTPFIVYYRVIANFSASGQGGKSTTVKHRTNNSDHHVNNQKMVNSKNKNGRSCDYVPDKNQNGKEQKFV